MTIQVRNPCNLQQVSIGIMIDSGNLPPPTTAASISGGSSLDPTAAEFPPITPVTSKAVATGAGVVPEESQSK